MCAHVFSFFTKCTVLVDCMKLYICLVLTATIVHTYVCFSGDTVCLNGGSCIGNTCQCPLDYSGSSCEICKNTTPYVLHGYVDVL